MPSTLTAHEQQIARIFSNDYVFNIPSYQRPYSWKTEQTLELFEDLFGFMQDVGGSIDEMPPYFLGSIVLIKSDASPQADVVDGQQRLTTLTILLSAIRSLVDVSHANEITQLLYERGSSILGTTDRFRLTLRERDRDFFANRVQLDGALMELISSNDILSDSQNNIRANARVLVEKLSSLSQEEKLSLAQFIVTRCYLVVVATPDLDSAYRIFSVMNSRGLDLSPTDILKAQLLGRISDAQKDQYTVKWEDAEEELGREQFSELFSHIRMIYRRSKPKGTLLKEFAEHVPGLDHPALWIDQQLLPYTKAFGELTDSAYEGIAGAEQVNESLRWLNRLEFTDWLPPAIEFTVRHRQEPTILAVFFSDLERLAYSLLLRRVGINERIERFSALTARIMQALDLTIDESPLQLSEVEKRAVVQVLDGPVYETLAARARTTLMLRLDSLLVDEGAQYDYPVLSVEHVLPQNPNEGSEWLSWFGEELSREHWTHRIGNLALLSRKKNAAGSNYGFERKKRVYFTVNGVVPFALTTQILTQDEWTPEIVEARQESLISTLISHWRLA